MTSHIEFRPTFGKKAQSKIKYIEHCQKLSLRYWLIVFIISTESVWLWWLARYLDLGCLAAYCCRDIRRNWPWRNTADRSAALSSIMLSWSHAILIHDLLSMNATYQDADMPVFNDTDQTRLTQWSDILIVNGLFLLLLKDSSKFLNIHNQSFLTIWINTQKVTRLTISDIVSASECWHVPNIARPWIGWFWPRSGPVCVLAAGVTLPG